MESKAPERRSVDSTTRELDDDVLMTLVDLALEQQVEQREAYLRGACGGDEILFTKACQYVQWEDRMNGFLLCPLFPPPSAELTLDPGQLLDGRFRILREIARGGMGIVYEAHDEKLDHRIAIKCAKAGYRKRLPPEVRNAREISHPNVCKIFEIHTASTDRGEIDFIAMEFLDGETLSERLRRGPLPREQVRSIARQLCAGLSQAHRNGVIHGDLKSNNVILVDGPGAATRAVITDFGLARQPGAQQSTAQSEAAAGTPAYMAPELWCGEKATIASDIYALGVILFELASGGQAPGPVAGSLASTETPRVEPGEDWKKVAGWKPPRVGRKWDRILGRCLDPDPAKRFQDADDIERVLAPRSRGAFLAAAGVVLGIVSALVTYERTVAPEQPLRLVVLPFSVEGGPMQAAGGIAEDVVNRVSGLRRNFAVISPLEAVRNHVHDVLEAKSALGATHVFRTRLNSSGGLIVASAALYDAGSGRLIRELRGSYPASNGPVLAKALTATITNGLGLRSAVLEVVSSAAYSYYAQGLALLQRDQVSADEAIPLFRKASEIDPNSALPLAGLAEAQIQKAIVGQGSQWLDQAGQTLDRARSVNPDAPAVLLVSALLNQRLGFYDQAIRDLNRAAQLEPFNAGVWRQMGLVYDRMNRPEEALGAYQKAISTQPGYYKQYLELGLFYYYRGRYREAEDTMRKVTALAPQLAAGHANMAAILSDQGRFGESETELLESLRIEETQLTLNNLGYVYRYEGRDSDALRLFEKSLAVGPPTIILYMNLGDTYRRLGRPAESRNAYLRGRMLAESELVVNPQAPLSRGYLALFWAQLGDPGQARFEIAQALHIAPQNTRIMRLAVTTYEVLQQREMALAVLRNAPPDLLKEVNREPDLRELQRDARFAKLLQNQPAN